MYDGRGREALNGRRPVQPHGSRVRGGSVSDLPPPARRGPRPPEPARLLGAHPLRGRGGGAARPAPRQGAHRRLRGRALRHGRAAARPGAVHAGPRPAGPHAPARAGQQGLHAAGAREPAPAHPADRGRPARRRRGQGPDGPDRGLRLPAAGPRHLRDARRAGRGPRALQGLGARHRARARRDHAAARLRGGPAQRRRRAGPWPSTSASSSRSGARPRATTCSPRSSRPRRRATS